MRPEDRVAGEPVGADTRPDTVSALERGIAVLRCFDEQRRLLTATELARATGIPRPTVTRLVQTLVALGLLRVDPVADAYALAAGVLTPARAFLAGLDVRAAARPHLQALADEVGHSTYLAVRDGLEMVIVEAGRPRASMLSTRLDVGSRAPIAHSALGRVWLAALAPTERRRLLETLRATQAEGWAALWPGLNAALDDALRFGWCLSTGDFHREINSIAVAIAQPDGAVMALNCGGPAWSLTETTLRTKTAPLILATARTIAAEIGGRVPHLPPPPSPTTRCN